MTREELLEKLKSGSVDWKHSGPANLANIPSLAKQREIILALKKELETVLEADLERLDQERERLDRIRRGGGK